MNTKIVFTEVFLDFTRSIALKVMLCDISKSSKCPPNKPKLHPYIVGHSAAVEL